ncbi:hypothetical protein AB0A70_15705 [Streptomyces morookaense]|uniref:hypothetical protein n=1 Tax=Streptomyces morookaense TaxID=1970 RepID=UPI0033C929EE
MAPNAARDGRRRRPRPPGTGTGPADRLVLVQWFELRDGGNPTALEQELLRYDRLLGEQDGLQVQVTLRLPARPGTYLHLGFWRSPEQLSDACCADAHRAQLDRLGRLAGVEAGQAVGAGLLGAVPDLAGAGHVVLARALRSGPADRFEMDFGTLVGKMLHGADRGGGLLLCSALEPRDYLGLIWWHSAGGRNDALCGGPMPDRRPRPAMVPARLRAEPAEVVAHRG